MSREIPQTPEKQPHWTDSWQPFHDHWEEILNLPLDALAIAENESESFEGSTNLLATAFGLPDPH